MSPSDVRNLRLYNQQISTTKFERPSDVVNWLVAMQAQEFRHAKWAIGLRLPAAVENDVEKAFNEGAILRTHVMRPTWHFVSPADIRWLLQLTAPRVHRANAPYYKKLEITNGLLRRSHKIIARSLEGGRYLKRNELQEALQQNKVNADGHRLAYIMMHAELERLICSGPRIGKQFTYGLLDERAPQSQAVDQKQALSMFLVRYFNSRGPATLNDFTYWSGLTLKETRSAFEDVKDQLHRFVMDGKEYYTGNLAIPKIAEAQDTFLMPDYDEYGMSYKDRSVLAPPTRAKQSSSRNWSIFGHYVVVEGTVQGTWTDEIVKDRIKVNTRFKKPLSAAGKRKYNKALIRYSSFLVKALQADR